MEQSETRLTYSKDSLQKWVWKGRAPCSSLCPDLREDGHRYEDKYTVLYTSVADPDPDGSALNFPRGCGSGFGILIRIQLKYWRQKPKLTMISEVFQKQLNK